MTIDPNGGYATAIAPSNAAGLRPFLTLALTALAMHAHWLHPSATYAWLGENTVCIVLGALALLEFLGDKIPAVDHALHAAHVAAKPIAAALVAGGTMQAGDPSAAFYGTIAASALNALGLHALVAASRALSTAFSAGAANPFVSLAEDAATLAAVAIAAFVPILGVALAVAASILAAVMVPRIVGRLRGGRARAA